MQGFNFSAKSPLAQRSKMRFVSLFLLLTVLLLGGSSQVFASGKHSDPVYVMNNAADGNAVLVFERADDGTLTEVDAYPTGGLGTGGGLGSQGALVLGDFKQLLFAVNAGSNEVSVFAVRGNKLTLVDTVPSGGERPISLTAHGRVVYVLNAGGSGNITGFLIGRGGHLWPIPHSTRTLSNDGVGDAPGPAQISFTPNGRQLVVTEKATNQILTYHRTHFALFSEATINQSVGATPFGFDFTPNGKLIVSEAFGGAADASAVSSYAFNRNTLQVVNGSVPTNQTAACWVVVTHNGKYAYTTNAGSGSVSGYTVAPDGSLALLDADGRTGDTGAGSGPIDAIISRDGRNLYILNSGTHTVTTFQLESDGSLINLGDVSVPAGSVGIAAG